MWKSINSVDDVLRIITNSNSNPQVIFKHSTSCSVSSMAKMRVEEKWNLALGNVDFNYLDILANRSLSNHIAERLEVHHESPQMILIIDGEVIYDSSHFDISIDELNESIGFYFERSTS